MKKRLLTLLLMLAVLLMGCGQSADKTVALTEDELAYFNGTEFFNHYETRCNQFLSSLYDTPEQIDLYDLLYCGTGVVEEMTEREELIASTEFIGEALDEVDDVKFLDVPCPCEKMTTASIDQFLQKYTGLTLAETDKMGLDKFIYLEDYDAYYHFHGDTNYWVQVVFDKGERQGDLIRLYYEDTFRNEGNKVVTLRQVEEGYQFVSNQLL